MVTKVSDTVVDTQGESQFKHLPGESSGLNFVIQGGLLSEVDDGLQEYPKQTLVLTDDTVNYVVLNLDNEPATLEAVTELPDKNILMYEATTVSGEITDVEDYRWKTVNNRFITTPIFPSNEPEYELIIGSQNGAYLASIWRIRGEVDSPYSRTYLLSGSGSETIGSNDSSSGAWAYGYWRDLDRTENYIAFTSNVNGSASRPRVFKRDVNGLTFSYIGNDDIDQFEDNLGNPETAQCHSIVWHPNRDEFVVATNQGYFVYERSGDTFSVVREVNAFSDEPSGNGDRNSKNVLFVGDRFLNSSSGGDLEVWDASGGVPYDNYSSIDLSTNSTYGIIPINNDEVLCLARQSSPVEYSILHVNLNTEVVTTVVEWVDLESDGWENGEPPRFFYQVGDYYFITHGTNSGSTSNIHIIDSDYNVTGAVLEDYIVGSPDRFITEIPDTNYFLMSNVETDSHYIGLWEFGTWSKIKDFPFNINESVPDLSPAYVVGEITIREVGTVSNPIDPVFMLWNPFIYINPGEFPASVGPSGNPQELYMVFHGNHMDEDKLNKRMVLVPELSSDVSGFESSGPVANSYGVTLGSDTELQEIESWASNSYIENFNEGTVSILFKTPSSFPLDYSHDTDIAPIFTFQNGSVFSGNGIVFGIHIDDSNAYPQMVIYNSGVTDEYYINRADTSLSTDSWYLVHFVQNRNGAGPEIWINGVESDRTQISNDYLFGEMEFFENLDGVVDINIGRNDGTAHEDTDGYVVSGAAVYADAFNEDTISRMASDLGLM